MSKKPIIVFEGIEGTGKSHHIRRVISYLKKRKKKFIHIREPGGSKNSEKIRKLILSNKSTFNECTDLLLYLAARSENIELIKKNSGKKSKFAQAMARVSLNAIACRARTSRLWSLLATKTSPLTPLSLDVRAARACLGKGFWGPWGIVCNGTSMFTMP